MISKAVVIWLWLLCFLEGLFSFSYYKNGRLWTTKQRQYITKLNVFDTIVRADSRFEAKCSLTTDDSNFTLTDYMKLPVDQYVCIKMPLDSTLERSRGNEFILEVPPVGFFNLMVSPRLVCYVTQDDNSVVIKSKECTLSGSPYIKTLNSCFKFSVETAINWIDTPRMRSILSSSHVNVEVDPPAPFRYFGKNQYEQKFAYS